MNKHARGGFTIIEVILFLGVTGLMMLGIFVGVWGSITQQRYKDAVVSFQESLRQTYGDVVAVQNNRVATASGDCIGGVGTSTCVILGRYLHVSSQSSAGTGPSIITVSDVIGTIPPTGSVATGYIDILRSYQPRVINNANRSVSQMQWQTQLRWPNGDAGNGFSMLVIRSPETGQIHTFTWRGNSTTPNLVPVGGPITAANETNPTNRLLCVDTNGMSVPPSGIRIQPRASTAAAIGQIANDAEGSPC
ncbi:MAG TPA: hypothetical protein PKD28_02840 [Candidatus Saccharibacteria bacterium]|nr:hypothetical protein [Candidatus Saccharibacteria bacterium]